MDVVARLARLCVTANNESIIQSESPPPPPPDRPLPYHHDQATMLLPFDPHLLLHNPRHRT